MREMDGVSKLWLLGDIWRITVKFFKFLPIIFLDIEEVRHDSLKYRAGGRTQRLEYFAPFAYLLKISGQSSVFFS